MTTPSPSPAVLAGLTPKPSTVQDIRRHNHLDRVINHYDTCLRCNRIRAYQASKGN